MTRRLIKYTLWTIAIVLILSATLVAYLFFSTKNPDSGTLELKGLTGKVSITQDQYGVAHIDAVADDRDAIFALGFIHARDRFWQMEFQRHVAKGTLCELFGDITLKEDQYLRTWGFYRAAQSAWLALDPVIQTYVHSYTLGVNAFLAQGHLPLEFTLLRYTPEPWTDIDSIAWQKMMAWNLQRSWEDKLINLTILKKFGADAIKIFQPDYPSSAPTILDSQEFSLSTVKTPKVALKNIESVKDTLQTAKSIRKKLGFADIPGKGSNCWVVSGKLTQSGKPILANDPHLQFSAPVIWYLAELKGPHLHVIGATVPGLPFVLIGHNDFIGWGVTDAMVDAQDLYIEPVNTILNVSKEKIKIKNKSDVILNVKSSKHGPLINEVCDANTAGQAVAIKWPALLSGDTTIKSFFLLNYANNWQKFSEALQWHVAPALNFLYADRDGNIGYQLAGKIPRRTMATHLPISAQDHNEWNAYIPFEQLPHAFNPQKGYLVSANNKIVSDNYPYPLTFRWSTNPYRAERIIDLINSEKIHSMATMGHIQTDTMSYLWQDLRTVLLGTKPLDQESEYALKELSAWDGMITVNKMTPTFFSYWYTELNQLMPKKIASSLTYPEVLFIKQQLQNNGSYCHTENAQDCQEFLSQSLQKAMTKLIKEHGKHHHDWEWGKIHRATFIANGLGEVKLIGWLWNRHIATASGDDTVNVGSYDVNLNQIEGAAYRQIIDFNDFDNSEYVIALGQSGNIFSPHYDDLLSLWNNSKYLPMSSKKIDQGKTHIFIIEPKK